MITRPGCVVFDIDDTLYLERDYVRSGFEFVSAEVRQRFNINGFFEIAWDLFESGIRGHIFDRTLETLGIEAKKQTIVHLVTAYREHRPDITLLGDSRRLIDHLNLLSVRLAAITDGPRQSQRNKIDVLGLSNWMSPIVLTAELGQERGKPHPAAFERVEQETGKTGTECCYIGDNPAKDFIAPKALGWRTIRIRRVLGLHANVASGSDVGYEVTTLDDLLKWT
jgi:putative hydrolase of the HAD superfamily